MAPEGASTQSKLLRQVVSGMHFRSTQRASPLQSVSNRHSTH